MNQGNHKIIFKWDNEYLSHGTIEHHFKKIINYGMKKEEIPKKVIIQNTPQSILNAFGNYCDKRLSSLDEIMNSFENKNKIKELKQEISDKQTKYYKNYIIESGITLIIGGFIGYFLGDEITRVANRYLNNIQELLNTTIHASSIIIGALSTTYYHNKLKIPFLPSRKTYDQIEKMNNQITILDSSSKDIKNYDYKKIKLERKITHMFYETIINIKNNKTKRKKKKKTTRSNLLKKI